MINENHISEIFITKLNILDYKLDIDAYKKEVTIKYGHRIFDLLLETSGEEKKETARAQISFKFAFKYENEDNPIPFMLLTVSCTLVMPLAILNEYTEYIDKQKVIKEAFVNYIYKLIYDTSRGILIIKTEGTSFNKLIMPHLPIKNSGIFVLEKEK